MPRRLKRRRHCVAEEGETASKLEPSAGPDLVFEKDGLSCFAVRVQPRSSRLGFAGMHGATIKIQLTAPAVQDRANRQLLEFVADRLGVSKSAVSLLFGGKSRDKTVGVAGLESGPLEKRLRRLVGL